MASHPFRRAVTVTVSVAAGIAFTGCHDRAQITAPHPPGLSPPAATAPPPPEQIRPPSSRAVDPLAAAAAGQRELVARWLASLPPPPVAAPPEPEPAPEAPPDDPCAPTRPDPPPGTKAWLDIADVGMHLPIVAGGQGTINSGVVAHYRASDWLPPVEAGAPGAFWLAAHNTCGLFARLPQLGDGAEVVIRGVDGSTQARYQVAARRSFNGASKVLWSDFYLWGSHTPYAVLQSCLPGGQRLVIYARAV